MANVKTTLGPNYVLFVCVHVAACANDDLDTLL
jgi:hypothetical protein